MKLETKLKYGVLLWQIMLAAIVLAAALVVLGGTDSRLLMAVLGAAVCLFVCAWWIERRHGIVWRDLRRTGFASCLRCGYDLHSLGEHGTCPECGERFILRETKARWKDARGNESPDEDKAG